MKLIHCFLSCFQGVLVFNGQQRATLHYSIPKEGSGPERGGSKADWNCSKCGVNNFRRRNLCFKCNAPREEAESVRHGGGEGFDEVSSTPTHTLLFRNLDILTTEERVLGVLGQLTALPIKSLRVAKDPLTNTSRGFCFVELHSTSEATQLHDLLLSMGGQFYIDGRQVGSPSQENMPHSTLVQPYVTVSYAKRSLTAMNSAASANAASVALAAAQWTNQGADYSTYNQYYPYNYATYSSEPTSNSQGSSAQIVQGAQLQKSSEKDDASKAKQAVSVEAKPVPASTVQTTGTTQASQSQSHSSLGTVVVDGVTYQKYPVPDVSTYQYDETSGFYYDPTTGLYYDANSQYYYNADSQQYLYWDGEKQSYLPAPTSASNSGMAAAAAAAEEANQEKGKPKENSKQDKVKIAKKIAKDMERWAKTLNQKKENAKLGIAPNMVQNFLFAEQFGRQSAAADAGFAILEKRTSPAERQALLTDVIKKKEMEEKKLMSFSVVAKEKPALVAAYGGESDSESEIEQSDEYSSALEAWRTEEAKLTDWNKIACLLCKRQFPSKEALSRHQQLSDLHKQNLDMLKRSKLTPEQLEELEKKDKEAGYRDRAKERREKYGQPDPPHPNRLKDKYMKHLEQQQASSYEEPTRRGIGSDNIGNKMLKAMGWTEGQGLGKTNQGMSGIVEVTRRVQTAGLGMKGSTYGANAGDTYKDAVKKAMQARYNEIV